MALVVKNLPANAEDQVRSLGQEDPLEKEMATHSSILSWKIPWTERSLAGYSLWGHKRVGHDLVTEQQKQSLFMRHYSISSLLWDLS